MGGNQLIIQIMGIPNGTPELEQLIEDIRTAVADVDDLQVSKYEIFVFLLRDHVQAGLGEELCVNIVGLEQRAEHRSLVIQYLIMAITVQLTVFARKHLPKCKRIYIPQPILVDKGPHESTSFVNR